MNAALFILAFVLFSTAFASAYMIPFGWRDHPFQHARFLTGCVFASGFEGKPVYCYSPMVRTHA